LSATAGHDIDYIALAGVLSAIGREGQAPVPPLNLVADFGGGGVFLALGVVAALVERTRSGEGQVIDVAMVDGAASLAAAVHGMRAMGAWADERGTNLLDTGAPFYDVYATADGGYMAVGALEPAFFAALLEGLGLDPADLPEQYDRSGWPGLQEAIAARFADADRAHWEEVFGGTDACVAPVLGLGEAASHPHNRARSLFIEVDGVSQPAPAPRFERTPGAVRRPPPVPGADTREALADWGIPPNRIEDLEAAGAIETAG
jgi:alpha-methylacyl-CoA racemase